ncbi:MAG: MAPEG family protein [Alphaproteobacteria bacterium]|nr:MAPEG family protein [Alphaproteobacteria bacterium]
MFQPLSFQVWLATAIVLGANLILLAGAAAATRNAANEVVNPEDRALNAQAEVVYEGGNDRTARLRRAHRNALENVPLFLVTGLGLCATNAPFALVAGLFGVFTAARLAHSVAYLRSMQPWRTASFAVGALDQLALLGCLAYYGFAA